MKTSCLLFLLFLFSSLQAQQPPVAYQGRFRPLDVYMKLWAKENHAIPENLWNAHLNEPAPESLLRMLPGKYTPGEWLPLKALSLKGGNFTLYSDETFNKLQSLYPDHPAELFRELALAYHQIAGQPYLEGNTSSLYYPTIEQLRAESLYNNGPWILLTLFFYMGAAFTLLLHFNKTGLGFMIVGFALHTVLIALRCYILGRPPVSNMFETVLYVPWIAVSLGFILSLYFRSYMALLGAALLSVTLFILLQVTGLHNSLDNVQAVLNSQYWLLIHVLLVVGSYGVFLLAGILAHFYLIKPSELLSKLILQSLYLGLALLIPGTLLGGVWAAESWGRFWDWDPKEAWAFISICIYLIIIHAYTFKHIAAHGLAIGAILGIQAIVFTWYGVNYILGTGLHSYGFGEGGELGYTLFIAAELSFVLWTVFNSRFCRQSSSD